MSSPVEVIEVEMDGRTQKVRLVSSDVLRSRRVVATALAELRQALPLGRRILLR